MSVNEWVKVDDKLPDWHCIVKVKRKNGDETNALFYLDGMSWIKFYGHKPCRFWHERTHEPLDDVIEWKSLK